MPNVQTQSTFSVYPWTNEGHTHHIRMNQSDELSIIVSDTSFVTHLHIATIVLIYIHVAPWLMHIPRSTNSIQCSQLISDTLFFFSAHTAFLYNHDCFVHFVSGLPTFAPSTPCKNKLQADRTYTTRRSLLLDLAQTQGYVLHINCYHPYVCLTLDLFFSLSLLQQAICTNI